MKFNQIILLILLSSILMVLIYQLLMVIDHHGSNKLIFTLFLSALADLVLLIGSFLFFVNKPSEKN